ncbi:rhomboid family intramembrane serine protease [Brumicola nitratireducens]|uniref:Rhomboid-like protein n=1 Tax=Glaciecola nitratireducens (strain JCM 12485 / KCTC 12276 / FR1064) TaxID=1085623 RepID=G4QNP0_GLANF|nr:rhomboid family intramembrane serine protease [Glaciecola nitratireducens]AEP31598.1 rhomboid-like protein [Glaciecola nitratireducens FR1064]
MKKLSLKNSILITAFTVGIIWCIKSSEFIFHIDLSWLGVYPQTIHGLLGILAAPLIHGSLEHIFNNTLPMLVLGTLLLYGYPKSRWRVLATIWILSGVGVWLFGRESYHIGASGLTHGVFFYLLVVSMFRRDKRSVAIMMTAFFLYGGMTMTIFPREEGISFEYHFFGALAGAFSAVLWHSLDPKPKMKTYEWEKQPESDDPIIGDAWQINEQSIDPNIQGHSHSSHKEKH